VREKEKFFASEKGSGVKKRKYIERKIGKGQSGSHEKKKDYIAEGGGGLKAGKNGGAPGTEGN